MKEKKARLIFSTLLVLLISFGILARLYWMIYHFTHYDDIGLISSLVYLRKEKGGLLDYFRYGWTYAPLQIIYTQLLVNPEVSYKANIILGRLPSFLCGTAVVIAVYYLIGITFQDSKHKRILQLTGVGLIATSWENIIYSAQAEPYEIGVLVVILLTIYCLRYAGQRKISAPWLILVSVFAFYSSYHCAIFLAALYICIFLATQKGLYERVRIVAMGGVSGFLCLPLLKSFTDREMLKRGLNWNIGVNGEFVFPYTEGKGFSILGAIRWFAINTFRLLKTFFVSNQNGVMILLLTVVFGMISLTGFLYMHRLNLRLALYFDVAAVIFTIFIIKGQLAYSPTRHMLLFYPVVLLWFCAGIDFILCRQKKGIMLFGVLMTGLIIVYISSSMEEIPLRKNEVLSGKIEEYIEKYEPENIVVFCGFDPLLMHWEGYQIIGTPGPLSLSSYRRTSPSGSGAIMMLGITRSLDAMNQEAISSLHEQFADVFGDSFLTKEEIKNSVIDQYITDTRTEVEYCRGHFVNGPSGIFIYILEQP